MDLERVAERLHDVDRRAGDLVRSGLDEVPRSASVTRSTTDIGSMFSVVGTAGLLMARGSARRGTEVLAVGGLGWMAAQAVKGVFNRERPYEAEGTRRLIPEPTGSSMPSGHAAVAAGVATVLSAKTRAGSGWVWGLLAGWVATTRVHLGVHYPGDTLAGLVIGRLLGSLVLRVSRRLSAG